MVFIHRRTSTSPDWISATVCCLLFLTMLMCKGSRDGSQSSSKGKRNVYVLVVRFFLGLVSYGLVYQGSKMVEGYMPTGTFASLLPVKTSSHESSGVQSDLSNQVIRAHDNYLGPRLAHNTAVDWERLMSTCTDSLDGLGIEDIADCLDFLSSHAHEYLTVSSSTTHSPSNAISHASFEEKPIKGSTTAATHDKVLQPTVSAMRTCLGQIYKYHTYWTGQATWRFELFIKGYLYTQNLACSCLWIWIDTDTVSGAIDRMLYHDALFQRFNSLLHNGYIELKPWMIPSRIPLPDTDDTDRINSNIDKDDSPANGIARDRSGQLWLTPSPSYKLVSTPTQVSDFVRFVVLHLHGGVYLDMDVLLLRDLRSLLLPAPTSLFPFNDPNLTGQTAWAEQWVERAENPGDYNTAVLSLPANSSLSSYLLRGGLRMGMNYHPRVLGRMLWKDGRNGELAMLHNAIFDPLVTNLRRQGTSVCTVPCHKNFKSIMLGKVEDAEREWSNYRGSEVEVKVMGNASAGGALRTNRTLEDFFRGAFAYHIHNQWDTFPERDSWMDVITRAQDGYFAGLRTNAYGEMWGGPELEGYDRSKWGWKP